MTAFLLILLVLSAGCFLLSALSRGRYDNHVSLVPLGLFFWVLVQVIQVARAL